MTKLIQLGHQIALQHVRARVFVVTSSLSAQKQAAVLGLGTIDPDEYVDLQTATSHSVALEPVMNKLTVKSADRLAGYHNLPGFQEVQRWAEPFVKTAGEKMGRSAKDFAKDEALVQHVIETAYESLPFPIRLVVKKESFQDYMQGWIQQYAEAERPGLHHDSTRAIE
jgi:hypothetical protein